MYVNESCDYIFLLNVVLVPVLTLSGQQAEEEDDRSAVPAGVVSN